MRNSSEPEELESREPLLFATTNHQVNHNSDHVEANRHRRLRQGRGHQGHRPRAQCLQGQFRRNSNFAIRCKPQPEGLRAATAAGGLHTWEEHRKSGDTGGSGECSH